MIKADDIQIWDAAVCVKWNLCRNLMIYNMTYLGYNPDKMRAQGRMHLAFYSQRANERMSRSEAISGIGPRPESLGTIFLESKLGMYRCQRSSVLSCQLDHRRVISNLISREFSKLVLAHQSLF